ncbi:hypothetical protein [Roseimaritima ulvae]|nr:hypothetical protein [Roseimaritima ulvae]
MISQSRELRLNKLVSMLFTRRPAIVLTLFAAAVLAITPPVSAGCLCDWLFGRRTTYAAAMPITPAPAYAAAMPVTPAYSAAMPVATYPAQTAYTVPTATPTSQYAAQMPAYGATTPLPTGYAGQYSSLYGGGAPSTTTPVAAAPAVTAAPITSYYGTGNVYPPVQTTSGYTANYMALQPVATVRTGGVVGGVRSFFGNLFGTNYRTSYYRAPVTYYRPQTTVDPVSGTTVTVQRPCTAYQYQVQRAPYIGLQPAAATPAGSCASGGCTTAGPYAPVVTSPGTVPYTQPAPLSSGGVAVPSSEGFVPRPTLPPASLDPYASQRSTYSPAPSYTPAPTYSPAPTSSSTSGYAPTPLPLTGAPAPTTTPAPATSSATGDYAPVAPPAMESQRVPQAEDNSSPRYWPAPPTGTVPDPPSTYARPIPAPPATWSQPEAAAPTTEPTAGRTASRPAWGFKKISWNASAGGVQQAGYQDGEAERRSEEALRRPSAMQLNAPQRTEATRSRPQLQNYPAPAPSPAASRSEYDNSGWRAAR